MPNYSFAILYVIGFNFDRELFKDLFKHLSNLDESNFSVKELSGGLQINVGISNYI